MTAHDLDATFKALRRAHEQALTALASIQEQCSTLMLESQNLKSGGILLPGWDCPSCLVFNGSAKEVLSECRSCGTARPKPGPSETEKLRAELKTVYENLTSVQARCTELLLENRKLKLDQRIE